MDPNYDFFEEEHTSLTRVIINQKEESRQKIALADFFPSDSQLSVEKLVDIHLEYNSQSESIVLVGLFEGGLVASFEI